MNLSLTIFAKKILVSYDPFIFPNEKLNAKFYSWADLSQNEQFRAQDKKSCLRILDRKLQ